MDAREKELKISAAQAADKLRELHITKNMQQNMRIMKRLRNAFAQATGKADASLIEDKPTESNEPYLLMSFKAYQRD